MNIQQLVDDETRTQIFMISAAELKEFAFELADQVAAKAAAQTLESCNGRSSVNLMTAQDVSQKLGVNPSTLWRWQRSGYLVPIKIGAKTRYRESDIIKLMEE